MFLYDTDLGVAVDVSYRCALLDGRLLLGGLSGVRRTTRVPRWANIADRWIW